MYFRVNAKATASALTTELVSTTNASIPAVDNVERVGLQNKLDKSITCSKYFFQEHNAKPRDIWQFVPALLAPMEMH